MPDEDDEARKDREDDAWAKAAIANREFDTVPLEEVVAALLQVDPIGISGKATKKAEQADEDE